MVADTMLCFTHCLYNVSWSTYLASVDPKNSAPPGGQNTHLPHEQAYLPGFGFLLISVRQRLSLVLHCTLGEQVFKFTGVD